MKTKSPNAKFWMDYGLAGRSAELADKAMPAMMEIARMLGQDNGLIDVVSDAANWLVYSLPRLSPEFQKNHAWVPPKAKKEKP